MPRATAYLPNRRSLSLMCLTSHILRKCRSSQEIAAFPASSFCWSSITRAMSSRALLPGFSARSWLAAYPMSDARQAERLAALMARAGL